MRATGCMRGRSFSKLSGVRVAFVEADVIEIQGHDVFRQRIAEATGIPVKNILLGDAHNHSAPSPQAEPKTDWDRQFGAGLVKAAVDAVASLQTCKPRCRYGALAHCHEPAPPADRRFGLDLDFRRECRQPVLWQGQDRQAGHDP